MTIKPSNIFLLELIVNDINTWHLPNDILECDESCVNFTFLDSIKLSMCERDFGTAMGRYGKNCLFVLNNPPDERHQIEIEVFKKISNGEQILIGNGRIPVSEIFKKFFETIFPKTNQFIGVSPIPSTNQNIDVQVDSKSLMGLKSMSSKSSKTSKQSSAKASETKVSEKIDSVVLPPILGGPVPEDKTESRFSGIVSNDLQGLVSATPDVTEVDPNVTEIGTEPNEPTTEVPEELEKLAEKLDDEVDRPPSEVVIPSLTESDNSEELKKLSAGGGSIFSPLENDHKYPISSTEKALYPLLMENIPIGVICVLTRLTCYGSTIVSPFHLGQQNNSLMLKTDDQIYRYAKVPEVIDTGCGKKMTIPCKKLFTPIEVNCGGTKIGIRRNVPDKRTMVSRPKVNQVSATKKMVDRSAGNESDCIDLTRSVMPSMHEISEGTTTPIINNIESHTEKCDFEKEFDEDVCPCPPTSVTNFGGKEYDEYSAEVNQNALIVRVGKESQMVTQIFEDECEDESDYVSSKTKKKLKLQCQDDGNNVIVQIPAKNAKLINTYGIPNIKGNLKYPSRFDASFQIPDCVDVIDNYKVKPANVQNCCIQTADPDAEKLINGDEVVNCYPSGIEVCKKDCSNPTCDVFILKLGKKDVHGKKNQIELELRTPKSPRASLSLPKDTRAAQTYEEDFGTPYGSEPKETKTKKKAKKAKK